MDILERLKKVKERFEIINQQLSDPTFMNDVLLISSIRSHFLTHTVYSQTTIYTVALDDYIFIYSIGRSSDLLRNAFHFVRYRNNT